MGFDNRLLSAYQLRLQNTMCTVLKQNPENPLNERKNSTMTSPVLMHYYIPPSKIQGAQQNNADEAKNRGIIMRVCQQSKSTWEVNQDLVPGSEEPVIESRFPSGKPENPENDEIPNSENDDMNNNKHELRDGRISRLGHYPDTSFILKSIN